MSPDYYFSSKHVRSISLLDKLPLRQSCASVIYCSHFSEHIPHLKLIDFLNECFRTLNPGPTVRLFTPDLEEMCSEYLAQRSAGHDEKADLVTLCILDQCVRQDSGGLLGRFFSEMPQKSPCLVDYVFFCTGYRDESVNCNNNRQMISRVMNALSNPSKTVSWFLPKYSKTLSYLFPKAFRQQNISFSAVGVRHQWLYDYSSLSRLLLEIGFLDVKREYFNSSRIPNFPFYPLDTTENGFPRKGKESMFVEASRPEK